MAPTKSTDDAQSSKSSTKSSKSITQKATDGLKKLKWKATELLSLKKKKGTPSASGKSLIEQNLTMRLTLHSFSFDSEEAKPKGNSNRYN